MQPEGGEIRGSFKVKEGNIVKGSITYTVPLLGGKLIYLGDFELVYHGKLRDMKPFGTGVLELCGKPLF